MELENCYKEFLGILFCWTGGLPPRILPGLLASFKSSAQARERMRFCLGIVNSPGDAHCLQGKRKLA